MKRFFLVAILSWPVFAEEPVAKPAPEPVLTAEVKLAIREAQLRLKDALAVYQKAQADFQAVVVASTPAGYDLQDNGAGLVLAKKPEPKPEAGAKK